MNSKFLDSKGKVQWTSFESHVKEVLRMKAFTSSSEADGDAKMG